MEEPAAKRLKIASHATYKDSFMPLVGCRMPRWRIPSFTRPIMVYHHVVTLWETTDNSPMYLVLGDDKPVLDKIIFLLSQLMVKDLLINKINMMAITSISWSKVLIFNWWIDHFSSNYSTLILKTKSKHYFQNETVCSHISLFLRLNTMSMVGTGPRQVLT